MDTAMKADQTTGIFPFDKYEEIAKISDKTTYIPVYLRIPEPSVDPADIYAAISHTGDFSSNQWRASRNGQSDP
jgi:hypothetical protein